MGLFDRWKRVTLDDLGFDVNGWQLDVVLLRLVDGAAPYPYDFRQLEAARAFYAHMSASNGGAMLSVDFDRAAGVELMRGVFKYRSPEPGSLAMYYVGVLALPFRTFHFQINVESVEHGTTGVREAMVAALSPRPQPTTPPVQVSSGEELFARMHASRSNLMVLPSDAESYDESFPDHPLSKVRALQRHVVRTLRASPGLQRAEAHRVAGK
jgi:hypothetical protein